MQNVKCVCLQATLHTMLTPDLFVLYLMYSSWNPARSYTRNMHIYRAWQPTCSNLKTQPHTYAERNTYINANIHTVWTKSRHTRLRFSPQNSEHPRMWKTSKTPGSTYTHTVLHDCLPLSYTQYTDSHSVINSQWPLAIFLRVTGYFIFCSTLVLLRLCCVHTWSATALKKDLSSLLLCDRARGERKRVTCSRQENTVDTIKWDCLREALMGNLSPSSQELWVTQVVMYSPLMLESRETKGWACLRNLEWLALWCCSLLWGQFKVIQHCHCVHQQTEFVKKMDLDIKKFACNKVKNEFWCFKE